MECLISKRKSTGIIEYNHSFTPKELKSFKSDVCHELKQNNIELTSDECRIVIDVVKEMLWAYGIVIG